MKKLVTMFVVVLSMAWTLSAQTTKVINGGGGGDYTTLKAAFDDINSGLLTGAIDLQIAGSTTETATAQLFASGMGSGTISYTSVKIYPTASSVSITGSLSGDTVIAFLGADNVTIDGRVNRAGSTRDLTIQNSATGASGNFVVVYQSDATNDSLKYATIKAQNTGTTTATYGLVYFGTAGTFGGAAGTGNDNDVVANCDIDGQSNSTILLNSNGTSNPNQNSGLVIANNLIHDFYLGNVSTTGTGGARFGAGNDQITVTGNSFYQTASRAYVSTTTSHNMLEFNSATMNGNVITKNYFGGTAEQCGGSALTVTGGAFRYLGVLAITNVGSTTATRIDSNVIRNFDITSAYTSTGSGIFLGFYSAGGVSNYFSDTVGAPTGTNSIKVTATANTGGLLVGFNMAAAFNTNVTNCAVGSLTGTGTGTNVVHVYGINNDKTGSTGTLTIDGCLVGSRVTSNSIQSNMAASATSNVHGIRFAAAASNDINGVVKNTVVSNLSFVGSGTVGQINGIFCGAPASGRTATYIIKNDSVFNLTNASANTNTTSSASVVGILHAGTSTSPIDSVKDNVIYNFSNSNTVNGTVQVYGIQFTGAGTVHVARNTIYNGSLLAQSIAATITGIRSAQGIKTYYNNLVSLGSNVTAVSPIINGLSQAGGSNFYFHNTFRVTGSNVSEGPNGSGNTFAFNRSSISNNDSLYNNIFYNDRTNGTATGAHFAAIFSGGSFSVRQNYNLYYTANNASKFLVRIGSADSSDFANFKAGTFSAVSIPAGHDANSLNASLNFVSATDAHIDNTLGSNANNTGFALGAWKQDADGTTRNASTPDIGADEFSVNLNISSNSTISSGGNVDDITVGGVTATLGASLKAYGTVTVNSGGTIDANGFTLTGTGSNTLSVSGKLLVPGTTFATNYASFGTITLNSGSVVAYSGNGIVIPNSFTYQGLEYSGPNAATLAGNVTVNEALNLSGSSGSHIDIGSNTLTLGSGATVSNAGSGKYLKTSGSGVVARPIAASGSFQFPVGKSSYNPVTVALGGSDPTETFSVRVEDAVNPSAIDNTAAVGRTWNIAEASAGGNNATLTFQWDGTSEGAAFTRGAAAIWRHNGSDWVNVSGGTASGSDPYTISTSTPVTAFASFIVGKDGLLPVELAAFTAVMNGRTAELTWSTATERNNASFAVERSLGSEGKGSSWTTVGTVAGSGTSAASHAYSYQDAVPSAGTFRYRLKQIDHNGSVSYSAVVEVVAAMRPSEYQMSQNYPNPFNPSTAFTFAVRTAERTSVKVYNTLGVEVATLFNDVAQPDQVYSVRFDAAALSSGTYFAVLRSASRHEVRKMLFMK